MNTGLNESQNTEKVRLTNIVGETKRLIMDEDNGKRSHDSQQVTDQEVKIAVELLNPDPHSLKSRG